MKFLSDINTAVNEMLADEIDKFFVEKKKQIKEKFTTAKMSYSRVATCRWKVSVLGKYNEDAMDTFMDVLKEDFQYIFEDLTLDTEW